LAEVIRCIAKNHFVSGVFDLWKIVPALAEVCRRQSKRWKCRRAGDQLWRTLPQPGYAKPSGQRILINAAWHCCSVPNRS
jgi:hypothetical protein